MKPLSFVLLLLLPTLGCANVADRMQPDAERGAERAAERQAQEAVVCLVTDTECITRAQRQGNPVEVVDAEGNPAESDIPPLRRPFWRLTTNGETVDGNQHLVDVGGDRLLIQLVHSDGTNLVLMVPEPGNARRDVLAAYYTNAQGTVCGLTPPPQPLTVEFLPSEEPWLRGTYVGALTCPDLTSQVVQGYFHVRRPEE